MAHWQISTTYSYSHPWAVYRNGHPWYMGLWQDCQEVVLADGDDEDTLQIRGITVRTIGELRRWVLGWWSKVDTTPYDERGVRQNRKGKDWTTY